MNPYPRRDNRTNWQNCRLSLLCPAPSIGNMDGKKSVGLSERSEFRRSPAVFPTRRIKRDTAVSFGSFSLPSKKMNEMNDSFHAVGRISLKKPILMSDTEYN